MSELPEVRSAASRSDARSRRRNDAPSRGTIRSRSKKRELIRQNTMFDAEEVVSQSLSTPKVGLTLNNTLSDEDEAYNDIPSPTSRRLRKMSQSLQEGAPKFRELKSAAMFASKTKGNSRQKQKLRRRGERVLGAVRKKQASKLSLFNTVNQLQDRRNELKQWASSMRLLKKQFEKQFDLADHHDNGKVKVHLFEHICKKVALVSDFRLKQITSFLDPDKTGIIMWREFMELVGEWPNAAAAHDSKESHRATSSLEDENPFLQKTKALLNQNPITLAKERAKSQINEVEYQANVGRWMKDGLEKNGLLDASSRRRDFDLFIMKHFTTM
eukprot:g1712.t1